MNPPRLPVVHNRQQIPTDPVHRRFDDGEHGRGGDRGVDRVAAVLQGLEAGDRCQRLAGRNHAVAPAAGRTGTARVAGWAIAGQNAKLWSSQAR